MRLPQFLPEEEQAELLLGWYQRYRAWVLSAGLLVLAVPAGWQLSLYLTTLAREGEMAKVRAFMQELEQAAVARRAAAENREAAAQDGADLGPDAPDRAARVERIGRGQALASSLDDRALRAQMQMILGAEAARLGEGAQARDLLRQAVATADTWTLPRELADLARLQLGRVLLESGDPDAARDAAQQMHSPLLQRERLELEGDVLAATGDLATAREFWRQALARSGDDDSFAARVLQLKLSAWEVLDGPVGSQALGQGDG